MSFVTLQHFLSLKTHLNLNSQLEVVGKFSDDTKVEASVVSSDVSKSDRSDIFPLVLLSLHQFANSHNGNFPLPWNENDYITFKEIVHKNKFENKENEISQFFFDIFDIKSKPSISISQLKIEDSYLKAFSYTCCGKH